jgi:hypothetical protein
VAMFEWKVTLDTLVAFAGFVIVAWQLWKANKQSKLDSQIRMHDINRELISMGFDKPELFEVLKDTNRADPELEQRYLQLWLNQLSMFYSLKTAGEMQRDFEDSCDRDLRDMFGKANMRRHWDKFGKFYPASFQKAIDAIIHKAGQNGTVKAKRPKR